jgi:imidazolonepropionase-like amidohydrolase
MTRHFSLKNASHLSTQRKCWDTGTLTILEDRFTDIAARAEDSIDCSGLFVIPGLIDAHAHIFGESNPALAAGFVWTESETAAFRRAERNASAFLRFGVTTVRDLGGFERRCLEFRRRRQLGLFSGPRFFTAGQFVTTLLRDDHFFGYTIKPLDLGTAVVDLCSMNADWIKIINDPVDFDTPTLSAAVELAHNAGVRVAIHAFTEEATLIAMTAGADSIEHSAVGWKSVLAHHRLKTAYFVPTLVCSTDVATDPVKSLIDDEGLVKIFQDWNKEQRELLPTVRDPDIRIGIGTDSGFPPTSPGLSLHREMQLLCELGFDRLSVLCNATALNAELLGVQTIGTLSPGCYADFVLLDGNPAVMKHFYQAIVSVFLGGRCVYGTDITAR